MVLPQIKKTTIKSETWSTPIIPPKPKTVAGVANPIIDLNETTGDGTWKFLFEYTDKIPLPTAEAQDFDFTKWRDKAWQSVIVPGGLVMQGFDIENNVEYYYQRELTIPQDFANNKVILRFHGVYSNTRIWINGRYVRTHIGGFTLWDCDITDFVAAGESVTLTVGFADLAGDKLGIWHQDGKGTDDPSHASMYAHHNIGGINRDVELIALPSTHIERLYTNVRFDDAFINAELDVAFQLNHLVEDTQVTFEIIERETAHVIATEEIIFSDKQINQSETTYQLIIPVDNPKQWDAEHPNLYTFRTTLTVAEVERQVNEENLGFREIYYNGKNKMDRNKIYVNGQEIKLRSTCRHDVSYDLGRSTTRVQDYFEILKYKEHNLNSIRTSHYPASQHLLDACDELGIYVEQETAVCFQGMFGNPILATTSDFMDQFTEMVEFDRNRPSIIIWSIGNESSYPKTDAFALEFQYIKEIDESRPAVFSFPTEVPEEVEPKPYDIFSAHYHAYNGEIGKPDIPVYHDEYAHIACYNLDELQRDVNVRNFWGESIYKYWENIFTTDGALGGALWGGIDDVFYIPENTQERWVNHSAGPVAGYGEWGSVLDAYMRDKPEAYLTKKAYSPVRVAEEKIKVESDMLTIPVKNWFDHTNFNELVLAYRLDDGEFKYAKLEENILPHESGQLVIHDDFFGVAKLELQFITPDGIVVEENLIECIVKEREVTLSNSSVTITETNDGVTLTSEEGLALTFSTETGLIIKGIIGNELMITSGPSLHLTGAFLGTWIPASKPLLVTDKQTYVEVKIHGAYSQGIEVEFTLAIYSNGTIKTNYVILNEVEVSDLSELGVKFEIPTELHSVNWDKKGFHSIYPADHIGRNQGTALLKRPTGTDQYGVKPNWPWKDDMNNYFVYATGDANDGIATNDFKTMRENIWEYAVNFECGGCLVVKDSTAQVAARVGLIAQATMIDDRDSHVIYSSDKWQRRNDPTNYNGTETYSSRAGDTCLLEFEGTGVRFIGARQNDVGKVKIYLDDVEYAVIDTFSDLGDSMKQQEIFRIEDLAYGKHLLKLETLAGKHTSIVVDAFEVLGNEVNEGGQLQASLIINNAWAYPNLGWGNYTGQTAKITKGTHGEVIIQLTK